MKRHVNAVQQWIDSIQIPLKGDFPVKDECKGELEQQPSTYPITTVYSALATSMPIDISKGYVADTTSLPSSLSHKLVRDPSLQSDSSHCSSVESLLELRKADPEAVLLSLGFGGSPSSPQEDGTFARIPKRFLQPSKLKGIAINEFMKQQQETSESFDSVSLGYRGLTGSPYVAPSEIVQKIMQRLREHENHGQDLNAGHSYHEQRSPLHYNATLSVLSPDNREFLERPRSKSPDMRNKRMIIGQTSFTFGNDGDLIEVKPNVAKGPSVSMETDIPNESIKQQLSCREDTSRNRVSNECCEQLDWSEPIPMGKRKPLKRQNRVSDANTTVDTVVQEKSYVLKCLRKLQNSDSSTEEEEEQEEGVEEKEMEEVRPSNRKCCSGESQSMERIQENREKERTCCCRSGPKKYWKKMEKLLHENRNLERMVTKNMREMTEIREMLNNVLSVRLEPGF